MTISAPLPHDSNSKNEDEENWDNQSTTSGHTTNHDSSPQEVVPKETLAEEETKRIWIWKQLVILLIIVTATLVSAGTYKFLEEEEANDFHDNVSL